MAITEPHTCTIDGVGPMLVVVPANANEVGELVRKAAEQKSAVFPVGGRTMLGIGHPPGREGVVIDLHNLSRVIDYPARDMTITVEAGVTLAQLQAILAAEGQRLPVDVSLPESATLGGAMAVNVSGPRRFGFGTLRDYVIGITTINDEGNATKAGGRVVKNVAGYDLCKLHIGALGTLGIITQATLKLKPIPEESALVMVACPLSKLAKLLDTIHASRSRPTCVDVLNERAAADLPHKHADGWQILIGYEDSNVSVRWQLQQLIREMHAVGCHGLHALVGRPAEPVWTFLRDFPLRADAMLTFKANMLPHATADFCAVVDGLDRTACLQAHAGNGLVIGHLAGDLTAERAGSILKEMQRSAKAAHGNVIVTQCPPAWKASLPIWGLPRGDLALMRTVREKLDPRGIFNPGRFLTGGPKA